MSGSSTELPCAGQPNPAPERHSVVRVASLGGIATLLRQRGIDPAQVLASVGLRPDVLDQVHNRISLRSAGDLLQRCVEVTGCRHFGLLVGQRANVTSLGIVGELMQRAPSLDTALHSLLRHLHLQTRGAAPTYSVAAGSAKLGYSFYQPEMPGITQAYDLVLAQEFNILRALCGPRWQPGEVSFTRVRPQDVAPYRSFFRAPLRFDAHRSEITFGARWIDHAPPGADSREYQRLEREILQQETLRPVDLVERIRRALGTMGMSKGASELLVSQRLSIPTRTMRRALAAQGTSFRVLASEVYFEIARQLLTHTDMSMTAIAWALGYADASAFTRAFRRWTQVPPAAWRATVRSSGP